MTSKKVLVIVDPLQTGSMDLAATTAEILDGALALANFEHEIHLLFKEPAIPFLIDTEQVPIIKGLDLYGIEHIWVSQDDFQKYQIQFSVAVFEQKPDVASFTQQFDYQLRFH